MDEEEQKEYIKYVSNKKNDYNRIKGFLEQLELNGLDTPKLQFTKHIRNILEIMEHDDKKFIEKKPKKKKSKSKGFE